MITTTNFVEALGDYLQIEAVDAVYQFGDLAGPALRKIADLVSAGEVAPDLITCPAWLEFSDLYEYAFQGVEGEDGPPLQRDFWDIISSVHGYEVLPPLLANVVFLANARLVLDGHAPEFGCADSSSEANYLTVLQVAALADMDSRSVRNAMSSSKEDRLVGEQKASRTVISVAEANRWLKGRRGFVPTTKRSADAEAEEEAKPSTLSLPQALVANIVTMAAKEGISIEALISRCLTTESQER